jgi:hypothetical protein
MAKRVQMDGRRLDLSGMPGPRGRGEVTRVNLEELLAAMEPQTVNAGAKRDREDVVAVPGMARGLAREAVGQALLLGYGDDIEGWATDRHPDDIKRERNAFADENRLAANAAYAGGLVAGGLAPRAIRALASSPRTADQVDELAPRVEPDLRQAMRNADQVEAANRPADLQRDAIERLLSNPEARAEVRGQPLELSPADIFTMTAGAASGASAPPAPTLSAEEQALQSMSPTDALRFGQELQQATPVSGEQRARNLRTTAEDALSVIPGPGNVLAARDAFQGAEDAGEAFGSGNVLGGLGNTALAALSGFGAVTGMPTSRAAGAIAREAPNQANVLIPAPPSRAVDRALSMRGEGATNRQVFGETNRFFGPEGRPRMEISDRMAQPTLDRFRPDDVTTMGEALNHPALYGVAPEMRDLPVRFTTPYSNATGKAEPVARATNGTLELSLDASPEWTKANLAKLLQYKIAEDAGFGAAVTHRTRDMASQYDDAVRQVQEIADAPKPGDDLGAALSWLEKVAPMRDDLREAVGRTGNAEWTVSRRATQRTAGNQDARITKARAVLSPEAMRIWGGFPYNQGMNYSGSMVLPQKTMTRDEVARFLADWQNYGAGGLP